MPACSSRSPGLFPDVSSASEHPLLSSSVLVSYSTRQMALLDCSCLTTSPLTFLLAMLPSKGSFYPYCSEEWNGLLFWGEGGHEVQNPSLSLLSPAAHVTTVSWLAMCPSQASLVTHLASAVFLPTSDPGQSAFPHSTYACFPKNKTGPYLNFGKSGGR